LLNSGILALAVVPVVGVECRTSVLRLLLLAVCWRWRWSSVTTVVLLVALIITALVAVVVHLMVVVVVSPRLGRHPSSAVHGLNATAFATARES
jgi:hypothetical protein